MKRNRDFIRRNAVRHTFNGVSHTFRWRRGGQANVFHLTHVDVTDTPHARTSPSIPTTSALRKGVLFRRNSEANSPSVFQTKGARRVCQTPKLSKTIPTIKALDIGARVRSREEKMR